MSSGGHPIRVAAARSGLTPDVLRAWERRYGAVAPGRTEGRRLYSEADIERLALLRRVTLAGRRIGEVVKMTTAALQQLAEADQEAMASAPAAGGRRQSNPTAAVMSVPAAEFRRRCLQAVSEFDAPGLQGHLDQAVVALGQVRFLDEVILPLMEDVGVGWEKGTVRIAQEHLATAVVQTFLMVLRGAAAAAASGPRIVVTTLSGQLHELGALVAAATAAAEGWQVTYLGPSLPSEEIAAAVLSLDARALALSLVYPGDDARVGEQMRSLRRQMGNDVVLIVGGPVAAGFAPDIAASGGVLLRDMASLKALLGGLRRQPPGVGSAAVPADALG